MADAILSGLVSDILGRLTSLAIKEFDLVWGFKDDVLTLREYFQQIQAVLEDAEMRSYKEKTVELWLNRLRFESLKMENVFDEVSTEAMLRKLHKELGIKYRVRAFFSSDHNQLMFRIRIAHKVKSIRKNIADIAAQRSELILIPRAIISVDVGGGGEMPNRETSSLIHSSIIYGRNEEMEMVVKKICNNDIVGKHDVVDDIRVYAIFGMGGLGKTTLAQLVYNHKEVNEHFELKCWMYVSEKFQVKELIRGIIESIDESKCSHSQLDKMQKCLQDKLRGKRFLVVLDDVWIEDNEKTKWEQLSKTLSCGAEGSIVVMTTRSKRTSQMMAKVPELQHKLGCLSEEDSWSLFKKLAFAEGREGGEVKELEPIGKKIVEKCKGLPLAVKTLGSLMWSKSCTNDWERVMISDIWELQEDDILPALKLSYDNLLPHLKRCFAYCCLFPKGHKMEKDVLITSWMTNRLIPTTGEAYWYLLGEEIINCLVWKSFFQVVKYRRSYLGERYIMHDMMHDLSRDVMKRDCLIIKPGKELITPEKVLYLSSSCSDFVFSDQDLNKLKSLRSIFIFAKEFEGNVSHIFDIVCLRLLYLVGISLTTLPESICNLKYLKYLNLAYSENLEVLPESIIYLQNLQVSSLRGCKSLYKMPEGMRYMRSLQHLDMKFCKSLDYLPVGFKELTRLRRLPDFYVGKGRGAQIGELRDLNLLEGNLWIEGLKNVEGGLREAKNANLKCKKNLFVLALKWDDTDYTEEAVLRDEEVLEGLEPNPSLKELKIYQCMGKIFSMRWMVNFKYLSDIGFYRCKRCEQIPPLGKLPSLKFITLSHMDCLKCFHEDDSNTSENNIIFPTLQKLKLYHCRSLVFLPSNFPKLTYLLIESCESLRSLPDEIQSFKDLNKLVILDCENLTRRYGKEIRVDWPKISHIPRIHFASSCYRRREDEDKDEV